MLKVINIRKTLYTFLIASFFVTLTVCIAAQIYIHFPVLNKTASVSSIPYQQGAYTGRIAIELDKRYRPDSNITILVNGMEVASLSTDRVELAVMNNSIVEIDGRRVSYPFEVSVIPLDRNINLEGSFALVNGNISRLSRVFLVNNN